MALVLRARQPLERLAQLFRSLPLRALTQCDRFAGMKHPTKAPPAPREFDRTTPISRAIEEFGSITKLASTLGVDYQSLQGWRLRGYCPAHFAIRLEQAVEARVTRYELRPDVFLRADNAGAIPPPLPRLLDPVKRGRGRPPNPPKSAAL